MRLQLHYREYGAGPPLLILHGLFGSSANWTTVAKRLAESQRVINVDLRNHGESPQESGMTYPDLAADVCGLLDRLQWERTAVLGHSVGGKVAMTLALQRPDRVERLVVVDIAPVRYAHDHQRIVTALMALDLATLKRRADADRALETAIPSARVRAFLLKNLVAEPGGGFHWRLNLDAIAGAIVELMDFPRDLCERSYTGPALFVAGAESHYVRPEHHPAIHACFPAALIETIPDATHWVHAERPDAFHRVVSGFLGAAEHTPVR